METNILLIVTDFKKTEFLSKQFIRSVKKADKKAIILTDAYFVKKRIISFFDKNNIKDGFLIFSLEDFNLGCCKPEQYINEEIEELFRVDFDRFDRLKIRIPKTEKIIESANYISRTVNNFLTTNQFECAFYEGPNSFFHRIIKDIFDKNNIDLFSLKQSRIRGTFSICDSSGLKPIKWNSEQDLNIDLNELKKPEYMGKKSYIERNIFYKIRNFSKTSLVERKFQFLYFDFSSRKEKLVYLPPVIKALSRQYIRLFFRPIKKLLLRLTMTNLNGIRNSYYIYPEHFHPEASTSAHDFEYRNDIVNVAKILKHIPDSESLVYKVHPSQYGLHTFSEIFNLFKMKRLIIVNPYFDNRKILNKNCLGVISISSTFILDAARCNIRSIVLGNYDFSEGHQNIIKSKMHNLKENLRELSTNNIDRLKKDWFDERLLKGFLYDEKAFITSFSKFLKVKYP